MNSATRRKTYEKSIWTYCCCDKNLPRLSGEKIRNGDCRGKWNGGRQDWKGDGWYRIVGDAGSKLIEAPVKPKHCGVEYPGWLYGGHPNASEGEVVRFVNFVMYFKDKGSTYGSDAYQSASIKVINCNNEYFVYYLIGMEYQDWVQGGGYCTE